MNGTVGIKHIEHRSYAKNMINRGAMFHIRTCLPIGHDVI